MRRILSLAVLLTIAAAWLWAHEGHAPLPTRGAAVDAVKGLINLGDTARRALDVQTAAVTQRAIEERLTAPAVLVAPWQRYAFATSRIEGRISALHVQPGQTVQAGQPLAEVQSLELENLQLEFVNAVGDEALSEANLAQLSAAARNNAVTEQELAEARARHVENTLNVAGARRKLLGLGVEATSLDKLAKDRATPPMHALPIRSPIAGEVVHADVQLGQMIQPSDHLIDVVDLSRTWVRIDVLEKDWPGIAVGQPVEVKLAAYPNEVFPGKIEVKSQALAPETYQASVWASIDVERGARSTERAGGNRVRRLLPGMFGQADIMSTGAKPTLSVPAAALIRDGVERFVLLEETAGQYARRNVVVGRVAGDEVEIVRGDLVPGDRVVTVGSQQLATLLPQTVLRPSAEAARTIGLAVEPARIRPIASVVAINGVVELPPGARALVSSRLSGALVKICVDRSQPVAAGQVVAELASLELQNLQVDLLRQHQLAGLHQETLKRLRGRGVKDESALTRRQLREAETAFHTVRQRRDSLQRKLEAVGLSAVQIRGLIDQGEFIDALPIRAPLAGVIVNFPARLGQFVKAEDPLFEIHDLSRPVVHGFASEQEAPRVALGQKARVRLAADPAFQAEGTVVRTGQVLGDANRTLSVWVELTELPQQPLLAGMMARLTLVAEQGPALLAAPRSAVLSEGSRAFVFVRQADGAFARREVRTGRGDDQFIAFTHGLTQGEVVAVEGVAELQTGYASLK